MKESPPEKTQVSSTTSQVTVIAGRTKYFISAWQEITADKQILEMIQGCPIEFESMPKQLSKAHPISHNPDERKIINIELDKLLSKGVIKETTHLNGEFLSSIFVRQKKDDSYRMILNLNDLNYSIEKKQFKMDTFLSAVYLVKQNCFLASVELRDAYYAIPICAEFRKYLRFEWQGKLYQYTCLPNGLPSASRYFTKILKAVYSSLRSKGHLNVGYIDDSYLQGDTFEECKHNVRDSVSLFEKLGFLPHPEKSVFEPTQKIIFLGFVINSVTMTISLTPEKALKICTACKKLSAKSECSILEVPQVIGLLVASLPAVQYGKLHYRRLEIDKNIALKLAKGNYHTTMCLSPAAKADLIWWADNVLESSNPISPGKIDIEISCDASKTGWGAVCNKVPTQPLWTTEEQSKHIHELELLAVTFALKVFAPQLSEKHVKIFSDNTTAVFYINAKGGTKSPACNDITSEIWSWCIENKTWLTAAHIPGVQNTDADRESRIFNERTEWQLNPAVFSQIQTLWITSETDLFATRANRQLAMFASWKPDPEATYIDAFTFDSSKHKFYCFLPFSLISRCLRKVEMDQAEGTLIAPIWPTQVWWPQMLRLLIRYPVALPQEKSLLKLRNKKVHPLHAKMVLMACYISGNPMKQEEFWSQLATSSWRPGTQKQYQVYIQKWSHFCTQRKINHNQPTVEQALDFFTHLYEQGLTYSTINTARNALSSYITLEDSSSLGQHPLVSRLLRGIFQSKPPSPRYSETWDVSVVLHYLQGLSPVGTLKLKELTLKLVTLILLVSGQGGQTVHLLDLSNMRVSTDSYTFLFTKLLKQTRPGFSNPAVTLTAFRDADQTWVF